VWPQPGGTNHLHYAPGGGHEANVADSNHCNTHDDPFTLRANAKFQQEELTLRIRLARIRFMKEQWSQNHSTAAR
jgi:hypothetical protein